MGMDGLDYIFQLSQGNDFNIIRDIQIFVDFVNNMKPRN
jgi:hypothetical protein